MNMISRKLWAGALALALVFALAGCGPKDAPQPDEPTPTPTPTPAPTQDLDSLGIDFLPDNATDVVQEVLGYPQDTALLTVNGAPVTAEEYLYWLGNMTSYYETMFSYYYQTGLNFDEAIDDDGTTWGEQLKEIAYQNAVLIAVTPEAAAQYGVTLDEEELAELATQREDNITAAGGEETYAYRLQGMGISDRTAFRLDQVSALFTKLQEVYVEKALTDGDPDALTHEDIQTYLEDEGILKAKHILLLTKDPDTNEEYDDGKKAEQKAKAEDILARLREDPALFDELMNENSEDSGLSAYPDGYLFGPGEMVSEFEDTTKALEVGEISDIVESTFGYHIILREDADCEEAREGCAEWKFNKMMSERVDNAVVERSPEYESLTTKTYYEGLTKFQDSLTEPTVEDQSNATLEPAPTEPTATEPTATPAP